MRLRLKALIGILISLILANGAWVIFDIRKEIQFNRELTQKELKVNDQIILDIYRNLDKINTKIDNNYKNLKNQISFLPVKEKLRKLVLEYFLKQVNVMIVNKTMGTLGSGVTIKYNDNYYILSAAHLVEEDDDELVLTEHDKEICKLEVVKHEFKLSEDDTANGVDLVLLRPKDKTLVPSLYAELADLEPMTAEEIIIVGNPMGFEDIYSTGRVSFYSKNFMYFRDSTYFGNSGGGLYNENGQVIGIMSHVIPYHEKVDFPPFVIEGAVRLSVIQKFLEGVK